MKEEVFILEANVDDVDGEILGAVIEDFTKEGALDVSVFPSMSKKSRPSHLIRIVCHEKDHAEFTLKLMRETGSLGVRVIKCERILAERSTKTLSIPLMGENRRVRVKISRIQGQNINVKAEFEDLRRISGELGLPIRKVREEVMKHIGRIGVQ